MDTPLKRSVLDSLKKHEASNNETLLSAAKNPANCDAETSLVEVPPTPLLRTLGMGTGVHVMCIKRNHPANATRSPWAIKMLSGRADASNKAVYRDRLLEEAKLLCNLSHPNIVGYRAFDTLEVGRDYLALEYCTTSLGNILEERYEKSQGPLEAAKAKKVAVHVLRGLDYLHTVAHILHGDMKSFNVLINKDFEGIKICDFGVSLALKEDGFLDLQKNPDARYVGTGIWSAPEVLEDDPALVSVKADIFSFGLVIFETITLMPPHTFPGIKDESIVTSAGYASLRAKVDTPDAKRRLELSDVVEVFDDSEFDPDEVLQAGTARASKRKIDACLDGMRKKIKASETPDAEAVPDEDKDSAAIPAQGTAVDEPQSDTANKPEPDSSTEVEQKGAEPKEAVPKNAETKDAEPETAEQKEAEPQEEAEDEAILIEDSFKTTAVPARAGDADGKEQDVISVSSDSESYEEYELDPAMYPYPDELIDIDELDNDRERMADLVFVGGESGGDETDEEEEAPLFSDDDDDDQWDEDDEEGSAIDYADFEEEEEEDDGPYLNYGVLGSRPPIPSDIAIDAEHLPLVELFHICTEADPNERPTARQLLDALIKSMGGDVDGQAEAQPVEGEKSVEETIGKEENEAEPTEQVGKEDSMNTTQPSE